MNKRAIDLYSGIGGWTLGMKLSGIENVASYEWWSEANNTHNVNFNTEHIEIDIRKIDIEKDLKFDKEIDFVVGSPPCTQFSFANKGGNGNLADGLVDVRKFLEIIRYLKPKYWAMENVPRVAKILSEEIRTGGGLAEFNDLVTNIVVVNASDYGVPQSRKRMIAGNFPLEIFESYKTKIETKTLGDVLDSLKGESIIDPNFGYQMSTEEVTDNNNEPDLTCEEARINRDVKSYHPVYNNMSFPDRLDKPARTVTATCTRVSRESIVVQSNKGFRRLNVRERGVVQSFPITYQFYGKTMNAKFKMIGNAVPPLLTYYIFQSFLEIDAKSVKLPSESNYHHNVPNIPPPLSKFDNVKLSYSDKRKFQYAVPNLRFGSGVRFELSNSFKDEETFWSFKFFHGSSKNIKFVNLDRKIFSTIYENLDEKYRILFNDLIEQLLITIKHINFKKLQELWVRKDTSMTLFSLIDEIGEVTAKLFDMLHISNSKKLLKDILVFENAKTIDNNKEMLIGFLVLSKLNNLLFEI